MLSPHAGGYSAAEYPPACGDNIDYFLDEGEGGA